MKKILILILINCFILASLYLPQASSADFSYEDWKMQLSLPLQRQLSLSKEFFPPVLRGIKINLLNPYHLNFLIDAGDGMASSAVIQKDSMRMVRYFMAALTTPREDLWVNLSPYEKNRIIPLSFGQTEMGRDLLAVDYLLKQLTASLTAPNNEIGKAFWKEIYRQIPDQTRILNINDLQKVWIVPETAVVYEKGDIAYIDSAKLKVMLQTDYIAAKKNQLFTPDSPEQAIFLDIFRKKIIPVIEKEVNTGKNFALLRQIFYSLILADWFKENMQGDVLHKGYVDKNKVMGINSVSKQMQQAIFKSYVRDYKKGVYNAIVEEVDPSTQEVIPRKYFTGGFFEPSKYVEVKQAPENLAMSGANGALLELPIELKNAAMHTGETQFMQKYGERLLKLSQTVAAWRPKNYPPGVDAHLDSHQGLLNDLERDGLLSTEDTQFMRIFVEGHDQGYALNLTDPNVLTQLEEVWTLTAKISGYSEENSRILAAQTRQLIELYSNFPALVQFKMAQFKDDPKYKGMDPKEIESRAKAEAGKESYMVSRVIAHGSTSILAVRDKFMANGFNKEEALGFALLFAAHHPGYPITMVNNFVIKGLIPDKLVPILLITGKPAKGVINTDEDLRFKLADYAAEKLLNIPKAEARYYAILGYALDRITPARRMTQFRLGNFVEDHGKFTGNIFWGGSGETVKKYPLIVTNIKDAKDLTLENVFNLTIANVQKEANAALESVGLMLQGLQSDSTIAAYQEKLRALIKQRSDVEIAKTKDIHDKILALMKAKFTLREEKDGDLKNLDALISRALKVFSQTPESDPSRDAIEYLLGVLVTIKNSPLAQNHIYTLSKKMKEESGATQIIQEALTGSYFDQDSMEGLLQSPGVVKETIAKGTPIITEGDDGKDLYFLSEGQLNVLKKDEAGKNNIIATIKSKKFFGELSPLTGKKRSATVIAATDVTVIRIPYSNARAIMEGEFFKNLMKTGADRLRPKSDIATPPALIGVGKRNLDTDPFEVTMNADSRVSTADVNQTLNDPEVAQAINAIVPNITVVEARGQGGLIDLKEGESGRTILQIYVDLLKPENKGVLIENMRFVAQVVRTRKGEDHKVEEQAASYLKSYLEYLKSFFEAKNPHDRMDAVNRNINSLLALYNGGDPKVTEILKNLKYFNETANYADNYRQAAGVAVATSLLKFYTGLDMPASKNTLLQAAVSDVLKGYDLNHAMSAGRTDVGGLDFTSTQYLDVRKQNNGFSADSQFTTANNIQGLYPVALGIESVDLSNFFNVQAQ